MAYLSYKKTILILIFIIPLFACGDNYTMTDKDDISFSEGILYTTIAYREGTPTLNNITFIIELTDKSYQYNITLKANTQTTVLLPLKAGQYYFSMVNGEADPDFSTVGNKNVSYLYGNMYENIFEVKPGKINYIGKILVQVNLRRLGKMFKLSVPDSPTINRDFYFFSSYSKKDIEKLENKFPRLTKKYLPVKQKITFGLESTKIKNSYNKPLFSYGYGGESYGKDPQGYNSYKWGMSLNEIKSLLKSENKNYNIINKNHIVDKTIKDSQINFYLSKTDIPQWKGKLYKIDFYLNKNPDSIKESIIKNHGFPTKQKNKWIWELSKTIITLEGKGNNCTLTYYSKGYKALEENI